MGASPSAEDKRKHGTTSLEKRDEDEEGQVEKKLLSSPITKSIMDEGMPACFDADRGRAERAQRKDSAIVQGQQVGPWEGS